MTGFGITQNNIESGVKMNRYKIKNSLGTLAVIAVIALAIGIGYLAEKGNKSNINKMISSKGGTITSIDARLMHIGPFYVRGKGQSIYKVDYKDKDGNKQEAWVRTGIIDDWIWDYKEEK